MKKIFISIFVLISVGAGLPTLINRSSGVNSIQDARLFAQLNLVVPRYFDTTAANLTANIGLDSAGAIIYTRSGNKLWKRNENPKMWEEIGTGAGGGTYTPTLATSSATSLTLSTTETYVFTGSGNTVWTLPNATSNAARKYYIKNRGTANITLQRSGSNQLFFSAAVNSIVILPGDAYIVQSDAVYWLVM